MQLLQQKSVLPKIGYFIIICKIYCVNNWFYRLFFKFSPEKITWMKKRVIKKAWLTFCFVSYRILSEWKSSTTAHFQQISVVTSCENPVLSLYNFHFFLFTAVGSTTTLYMVYVCLRGGFVKISITVTASDMQMKNKQQQSHTNYELNGFKLSSFLYFRLFFIMYAIVWKRFKRNFRGIEWKLCEKFWSLFKSCWFLQI